MRFALYYCFLLFNTLQAIQNNPAFIQLRKVDAAKEIAAIVANSSNKVYLSADTLQLNQLGNRAPPIANVPGAEKKSWM